jgi:signal transduction histidine kinase
MNGCPTWSIFLRFNDPQGKEVFFYLPPGWEDFNYNPLVDAVASGDHRRMITLKSTTDNTKNVIAFLLPLSDGSTLQCGVMSNSRHRLISSVKKILTRIITILVGAAFIMGVFVTSRALRPIVQLNSEIEEITKTAKLSNRLSIRNTGDQIDTMALRINAMLNRIEELVDGIKGTLDNTAHDLRTPLTRLMGRAELAMGGTEEEKDEALAVCQEESRYILTMLNTLMDISAAEKGLIQIREEPLILNEILEQIYDLYELIAEDRGVEFHCSCPERIYLKADPLRLHQALSNLVDNGLKFTPPGGRVDVEIHSEDQKAIIKVKDTGPGISDDEKNEVWKRLYRGEKSRTSPGMGLGLSMVKAVIEAHHGSITLKDNPDGGSVFTIILQ